MTARVDQQLYDYLADGLDRLVIEYAGLNGMLDVRKYDDLPEEEVDPFYEHLSQIRDDYGSREAQLKSPPAAYLISMGVLKPRTWLVHRTKKPCFGEFDRGTTIRGLHLATWKSHKTKVKSRSANLSPSLSLARRVWGFAFFPEDIDASETQESYGDNVIFFQSDQGVVVEHLTDEEKQIIFPVGADYNHVCGAYEDPSSSRVVFTAPDGSVMRARDCQEAVEYLRRRIR
jgi:hypothetical protein